MIKCIDNICDVLRHITCDEVILVENFLWKVSKVCTYNLVNDTVLNSFVKLSHTVCKEAECCNNKDTISITLLKLCSNVYH